MEQGFLNLDLRSVVVCWLGDRLGSALKNQISDHSWDGWLEEMARGSGVDPEELSHLIAQGQPLRL